MSLYEWLVRKALFPAHECLRGRATLREIRELSAAAQRPRPEAEAEVQQRLGELLRFAGRELPFYTERFATCGVDPEGAAPQAELARLPLLHKADVRANTERMVWRGVPGGLVPCVSGGTTGDTLRFYIDRLRAAQSMGARLFMQSLFGVHPGDRRMWLWASPIELKRSWVRRWRDRLINEIVLNAFDVSPATLDTYVRRIIAYRPRVIFGYTSAVALLARHAAKNYAPRHFRDLRLVVLTADEVKPAERAAAAAAFGCPVASEYGSRDVGLIAHDCPRGRMHVISPHVYVEITQHNRDVPVGQIGNVTCTNLNTRAQPLIRYAIGDLGRFSAERCACGLPWPVLDITAGRINGFVALPNGKLCSSHVISCMLHIEPGVVQFKVFQRALDKFEVLLVVNDQFRADGTARLARRFDNQLGRAVQVDCRLVDRISPDPSGKRRCFVSTVAPQCSDFELVESLIGDQASE